MHPDILLRIFSAFIFLLTEIPPDFLGSLHTNSVEMILPALLGCIRTLRSYHDHRGKHVVNNPVNPAPEGILRLCRRLFCSHQPDIMAAHAHIADVFCIRSVFASEDQGFAPVLYIDAARLIRRSCFLHLCPGKILASRQQRGRPGLRRFKQLLHRNHWA